MASAEITRQGFSLKPSELQIGTSALSGGAWEMGDWGGVLYVAYSIRADDQCSCYLGKSVLCVLCVPVFRPRLSKGSNGGSAPCMFLSEQYAVLLHSSRSASPRRGN